MNRPLSSIAIVLGLAGLIPFVACALAAIGPSTDPFVERAAQALLGYGAIILGFLGGVHWGFALIEPDVSTQMGRAQTGRFGLGVLPSIVGWGAVLLGLWLGPNAGLALLIAGFVGLTVGEARARQAGLVPAGYMWLRWVLSVVVILTLVSTVLLRLSGARVVF